MSQKPKLDGIEREKLPADPIPETVQTPASQGPESEQSRESIPPSSRPHIPIENPGVDDIKTEFDSLAKEIEIAEQRKIQGKPKPRVFESKKQVELDREIQLELIKAKAQKAKSTLFWGVIAIAVAIFLFYYERNFYLPRRTSSNLVFLIIFMTVAVFGRRRW